jgi:hypothetical protein
MARQRRPSPNCLNCGAPVPSRFCPECGQENNDYHVSLGRLVADLFEELFQLESRLWRSLWTLFRRPGLLTREYNAGRRVSYTTPLRLYLIASVVYFFVGSLLPHHVEPRIDLGKPTAEEKKEIDEKAPPVLRGFIERAFEAQKDPKAANRRIQQTLAEWGPRIAAGMVPWFALLTFVFFRRPKRLFVEHLVFALHLHATGFLLLTIDDLVPWDAVNLVTSLVLAVVAFMAMRRVFGQSRLRTLWKFVLIWLFYGIALGVGILVVAVVGFLARG